MRRHNSCATMRLGPLTLAIAAAMGFSGAANALEFDTGIPDVKVRWDNTVRYNLAVRTGSIGNIGNNPAFDEGEYKFGRGDVVSNRLDLLSELDFTYQQRYGLRLSAAGWYDQAYHNANAVRNPDLAAIGVPGSYVNDAYTDYTKRYYRGPSGEFLDAFLFGKFDLGETPLTVKLGRHTVYWGESLLFGGALHGVSYSQMPVDLAKAFATPGSEAKELFRPLNNLSAQIVPTDTLTVAAQYFFDWQSYRYPEGGTYLGPADFAFYGPQRQSAGALGVATNAGASEPKKHGDWGINARWSPAWLDGTLGFYYRNYTDKAAAVYLTGAPGSLQYKQYYGEDIDLFGISLAKQLGGVSVGAELSYRKNTPLTAQTLGFATAPVPALAPVLYPNGAPALIGNSFQARGNTWHAVVNALGLIPRNPLFDTATWAVEMTYSRLDKVTANQDMFFGEGYGVCNASRQALLTAAKLYKDKWDGCATKDVLGISVNLTPTWFQVFPGVDLSTPVSYSRGLHGNAPTVLGGSEGNGTYSIGFGADVDQRYRFDLRYVGFYGKVKEGPGPVPGTTMVTSPNGLSTLLKDRGFLAFTFKTTF